MAVPGAGLQPLEQPQPGALLWPDTERGSGCSPSRARPPPVAAAGARPAAPPSALPFPANGEHRCEKGETAKEPAGGSEGSPPLLLPLAPLPHPPSPDRGQACSTQDSLA